MYNRPINFEHRRKKMSTKEKTENLVSAVRIQPLEFGELLVKIVGTAPYMQAAFSQKAMTIMEDKHRAGSQARSKKTRTARDFESEYLAARHLLEDGTCGIPAAALRNACIRACSTSDIKMTQAKLSIFFDGDGYDQSDGQPLVRIFGALKQENDPEFRIMKNLGANEVITDVAAEILFNDPVMKLMHVRNQTGVCDLRARPYWHPGWSANVKVRWDLTQFSATDVLNLLNRAGQLVGIGEGRPGSRNSAGIGYGLFVVEEAK